MSIRKMSEVWEKSGFGGSELLLLVAIADFSDDDGKAWPSIPVLAQKIRMSERNVQRLIAKLVEGGELAVERGHARGGCNLFLVMPEGGDKLSPGVTSCHRGGDKGVTGGVTSRVFPIGEPSVNHQTTSSPRQAEAAAAVPCPVEQLVASYHRLLPNNPKCKVINANRSAAIRARWREAAGLSCKPFGYATTADGIRAWNAFFEVCADSEFLTGRSPRRDGDRRPPFLADIDFLFSPSGFARCLENKYHREAA